MKKRILKKRRKGKDEIRKKNIQVTNQAGGFFCYLF